MLFRFREINQQSRGLRGFVGPCRAAPGPAGPTSAPRWPRPPPCLWGTSCHLASSKVPLPPHGIPQFRVQEDRVLLMKFAKRPLETLGFLVTAESRDLEIDGHGQFRQGIAAVNALAARRRPAASARAAYGASRCGFASLERSAPASAKSKRAVTRGMSGTLTRHSILDTSQHCLPPSASTVGQGTATLGGEKGLGPGGVCPVSPLAVRA